MIAPLCVGQDATRIGPLMGEVQDKLAVFGRGGPFTYALSAVDIALWRHWRMFRAVTLHGCAR